MHRKSVEFLTELKEKFGEKEIDIRSKDFKRIKFKHDINCSAHLLKTWEEKGVVKLVAPGKRITQIIIV